LLLLNSTALVVLWKNRTPEKAPAAFRPPGAPAHLFLIRQLQLDKQQQAVFDTMRQSHHRQIVCNDSMIRVLKEELFSNISAEQKNDSRIEVLTRQVGLLEARKDMITIDHFRALRHLLNKEQQKKFDGIIRQALNMIGQGREGYVANVLALPAGSIPAMRTDTLPAHKQKPPPRNFRPPPPGSFPPTGPPPQGRPPHPPHPEDFPPPPFNQGEDEF
jgi:Spy/CpxP family protein refolding chaperone